jgi:hypothetical protein
MNLSRMRGMRTLTAAASPGAPGQPDNDGLGAYIDSSPDSSTVKVYEGPGWSTDAFVVTNPNGVLGNVNVRRAL